MGFEKGTNPTRPRGKAEYGTIFISTQILNQFESLFKNNCYAPKDINHASKQLRFVKLFLHEFAHFVCYLANFYPVEQTDNWDNGAEWEKQVFGYTYSYDGNGGYAKREEGGLEFLKGKNVFSPFFRGILYYGNCNDEKPYFYL